jgi:hypothetical protein
MMTSQRSTNPLPTINRAGVPSALPVDAWRSACGPDGGNCVEVNLAGTVRMDGTTGIVGIRDSKPGAGPALVFGAAGWLAFLAGTVADNYAADKYCA